MSFAGLILLARVNVSYESSAACCDLDASVKINLSSGVVKSMSLVSVIKASMTSQKSLLVVITSPTIGILPKA